MSEAKGRIKNMNKRDYESTNDYKKSIEILKNFVRDVLDGDIEKLKDYDFTDLTTYVGDIIDPDMYLITQAIYIILWGDLYDLTFETMGAWNWNNEHAFRGDTMNSFGSLFGKEDRKKDRSFAFRAKFYHAEENPRLWTKIRKFSKSYHCIGNFILIPNRGTLRNGINGARARYYNREECEGMRDYFDWFLISIAKYQKKVEEGDIHLSGFEMQLQMNPEYNPAFLPIKEWEEQFFLKPYFKNGEPVLLFKTPLEERLKVTDPNGTDPEISYYKADEYLELLEDFLDKSENVIKYRTNKIIEALKKKL